MRLALTLALTLALPALAQEPAPAPAKKAPSMADMMPKPGPEMTRMKALTGTWDVEEIHEPGVFGPGGKGKGLSRVTWGPGGLSLLIDYRSTGGHMAGFRGHGVMAWDAPAKAYKQAWADNMMAALMVGTGSWEGEAFVMLSEGTVMGKSFKGKDTFSQFTKEGFTLTSEASIDGSPMAKMMTLVHRRASKGEGKPGAAQ